jgi:hypothetical protein
LLKACCVTATLLTATQALAKEREFCANRPGPGAPACTLAPARAMHALGKAVSLTGEVAAFRDDDPARVCVDSLAVGLAWQFH